MRRRTKYNDEEPSPEKPVSEILILPDGRLLVHNLSPVMARLLARLNPADEAMKRRARRKSNLKHELPN